MEPVSGQVDGPDTLTTILVVDDEPGNLLLISRLLRDAYRVKVAASGPAALDIVHGPAPPGLVLLDVLMPEMDGFEVCRRIKEDPSTKDIPVIFLTGLSDQDSEERGLAIGGADFVAKPVSAPLLHARIRTQLVLRGLASRLAALTGGA